MKRIIAKNGLILGLFAVITSGLIALTFFGTQEQIEYQRQQTLLTIFDELVPQGSYNNEIQQQPLLKPPRPMVIAVASSWWWV